VSAGERAAGESAGIRGNWLDAQNGIDLAAFPVADRAEQRCARRQLDISDTPLAVCVARVCRQKGQDVLLAAWPAVRAAVPNAQLALVGGLGAGGESMVRRETMPAGAFHVGQQDDPRPWYAAANVVVAPSRWEGASLGLMEAMACGRSIVATDVAGVGENVPAGTGAVVPRADLHALATALSNRLADPAIADTEGAAAAMFAQRAFSITTKTDALVDQYRCVINKPPRTSGRDGHSAL
jgi:glycosyltransferase involved in cell wall biosynthesis